MSTQSVIKTALAAVLILMIGTTAAWANTVGQPAPKLVMEQTAQSFDPVVDGTTITLDFVMRNEGDAVLNINKVKSG